MVVELIMQYCIEYFYRIHLRHIKRFNDIITEFESKVNFQNHPFGWVRFENRFSSIIK